MSFAHYPAYKESGVDWVGPVPAHWTTVALKHLVDMRSGEAITSENINEQGEYPVFGGNGLRGYTDRFTHEGTYALIGRQGALCGNVNYAQGRFWASEHAIVCTPRVPVAVRWLGELLRSMDLGQYSIAAAQPGLSVDLVSAIRVPVPPSPEQRAIAGFLDRETAKIDALVGEQERLIELLKEKRQAVISHAVTKGLNPSAPMKDSGIGWIGCVPEHWVLMRGSSIGTLFGSEPVPEERVAEEGTIPFLKVASLSPETFSIQSWDWYLAPEATLRTPPRRGFIVFPKRGAAIFSNKVNIVDRASVIDPNLMGWQIGNIAVATFVAYLLKCRKLEELADISSVPQINHKHLAPELFPVPPLQEQRDIATFLDSQVCTYSGLIEAAQHAIELLQERRAALISAAVTGQIDVRATAQRSAA